MREKREVQKLVNLENPQPFVYASGRYSNEFNKTTVAFPIAPGRNGNVLVYDLRYSLNEKLDSAFSSAGLENSGTSYAGPPAEPPASQANLSGSSGIYVPEFSNHLMLQKKQNPTFFPIVKELCYNKCPAVAPVKVLDSNNGWEKIGLTLEVVERNLQVLTAHPDFVEKVREAYENRPEFPPAIEPEAALYDGFLNDVDRVKVAAVRNAEPSELADFHPDFGDPRLPELLLHYKGRNYPECLSEEEMVQYDEYRHKRLDKLVPQFLKELENIKDQFLKEELLLYLHSL